MNKQSSKAKRKEQEFLLLGPRPKDAWLQDDSESIQQSMIEKDSVIVEFENGFDFQQDDLLLDILQTKTAQRVFPTMDPSNIEKLIAVCSRKLDQEPSNRKALFIRASSYLKKGHYFDAQEDCNRLIALDENYAGAYYIRGYSFEKLNEFHAALHDYSRVLVIDPLHVNAVFARGACLNKMVVKPK